MPRIIRHCAGFCLAFALFCGLVNSANPSRLLLIAIIAALTIACLLACWSLHLLSKGKEHDRRWLLGLGIGGIFLAVLLYIVFSVNFSDAALAQIAHYKRMQRMYGTEWLEGFRFLYPVLCVVIGLASVVHILKSFARDRRTSVLPETFTRSMIRTNSFE